MEYSDNIILSDNTDIFMSKVLEGKRVAFLTLGCKVNSYESDAIREQFKKSGAVIANYEEDNIDIYVVNTCSVTNIADRKSRQMLHRFRQKSPSGIIVATGCYAQLGAEKLIEDGSANLVAGNSHKAEIVRMVAEYIAHKGSRAERWTLEKDIETAECENGIVKKKTDKADTEAWAEKAAEKPDNCLVTAMTREHRYEEMSISSCEERTRAFIKIEDGCNQFCSYCIIPFARGRVRSRSIDSIVAEVKTLAEAGFKEVVLTGIHVSSYGLSDYEDSAVNFRYEHLLDLINAVSKIEGLERIRLGSLEPRIICREFAEALAANPKFCPHFHLSLQSGSGSVLKRMHRHYSPAEFYDGCLILREIFDRPSINTDVIVGFPGETTEEFEESKEFLAKVNFAKMHIFKYSRRKGTVADRMSGQLTEAVKHARSIELAKMDEENHSAYMEAFIGETQSVLFETVSVIDGQEYLTGLTTRYVGVAVPAPDNAEEYINEICMVNLTGKLSEEYLIGSSVQKTSTLKRNFAHE